MIHIYNCLFHGTVKCSINTCFTSAWQSCILSTQEPRVGDVSVLVAQAVSDVILSLDVKMLFSDQTNN